jgi:uncharacterized protein (DUF983 family)
MSDTKSGSITVGPGFPALLTLLFIGLKLTGYITWSWVWVLSPLWIGLALMLSILVIGGILFGISRLIAKILATRKKKKWAKIRADREKGRLDRQRGGVVR